MAEDPFYKQFLDDPQQNTTQSEESSVFSTEELTNLGIDFTSVASDTFQGFNKIKQATELRVAGSEFIEDAFEDSSRQAIELGRYNAQIADLRTQEALNARTREFERVNAQNRVAFAQTNLKPGSQSYMEVANETLDTLSRDLLRLQEEARQRKENIMFQASQQKVSNQQKIQEAKFQQEVAEFQRETAEANTIGSMIKSAGSLSSAAAKEKFGKDDDS